ncbi:DUF881 domain-containing protein [Nostocoides japonicum]|nr:DUF881 domain-containing protein [Tetrasphaera japonica]
MTDPTSPAPAPSGWRTLLRMSRPRATKANALAGILALLLGFAIATQVHQTQSQGLESLREDELVRLLDDVQTDNSRLADEIRTLEAQRDQLANGAAGSSAARAAAEQRVDSLGILAGTVRAKGPGITMRISDPKDGVTSALLLDTVEELRDGGAEAIQIDDVRVVASTYFTDLDDGGVSASDTPLTQPYVITAIGDASTLAAAMAIPGGVTESVKRVGASISVSEEQSVTVDALHTVKQPQYARPVSPATSAAS